MRFATKTIRAGQEPEATTGAIVPPVFQTVNFEYARLGQPRAYEYSRVDNPTRVALERRLASLEEAKHCAAFASGMAAVDGVLSILRPATTSSPRATSTAAPCASWKRSTARAASP